MDFEEFEQLQNKKQKVLAQANNTCKTPCTSQLPKDRNVALERWEDYMQYGFAGIRPDELWD